MCDDYYSCGPASPITCRYCGNEFYPKGTGANDSDYNCPRCGKQHKSPSPFNKIDVSFECYAAPFMYIFNGSDELRIPKTVSIVNNELKDIRSFYWYLLDKEGTVDPESLSDLIVPLDDEDYFDIHRLRHNIEVIHQVLAPLFINEDVDGGKYNKFMKKYLDFLEWVKKTYEVKPKTLKLNDFYEMMCDFAQSIQDMFMEGQDVRITTPKNEPNRSANK